MLLVYKTTNSILILAQYNRSVKSQVELKGGQLWQMCPSLGGGSDISF